METETETQPRIFSFKDAKFTPDPVYSYSEFAGKSQCIVIDNGSYQCRAGWGSDAAPRLIFRNLMAKLRKEKGKMDVDIQVGNEIANIEAVRFLLKSPFDRDVVTHYEVQEAVLDYVFSHLGINTEGKIDHPLVMTETLCNPNISRQQMNELLFECYEVPSVATGVDALFGLYHSNQNPTRTALLISCGHQTTHIIPVINGKFDVQKVRRLNVGGLHMSSFLQRLIQLKYPAHAAAVNFGRAEELLQDHCSFADDYQPSLQKWAVPSYYESVVRKFQLPFSAPSVSSTPSVNPELLKEKRRENSRRLVELNAKRREEKLMEDERRYRQLEELYEYIQEAEEEDAEDALREAGLNSEDELLAEMQTLRDRIRKAKNKPAADAKEVKEEVKAKQPTDIPTDKAEFDAWISNIRQQRQELLNKRQERRQRRSDMAKRRTAAAQERMRILSQLARKDKKEDTFGANDEDWDVYKSIAKDGGSDSEAEQEKLSELETLLKRHDLEFKAEAAASGSVPLTAEWYQLHLATEQIRVPELLFQPSMVGLEQAGLAETIEFILKKYDPETQNSLVSNVFITGGLSNIPGLQQRLDKELREMRPFESQFNVTMDADPSLSAWKGARSFSTNPNNKSCFWSRSDYQEKGTEYFKDHSLSNMYFPTPTENAS